MDGWMAGWLNGLIDGWMDDCFKKLQAHKHVSAAEHLMAT